jgi:hypothetical protein
MGHVFISHGSEDRDEAVALSDFIEARGIRTWIAPRDVRPGQDYSEQLQQAIEECAAFVVLVTDKANSSPYVRAETEMAFSTKKPIFPVRQSDIQPAAGLAFFLKIRHWTDAFGKHGNAAMDRLGLELDAVCGVSARAADAPPPVPPREPEQRLETAPPPQPPPPPPPAAQEERMRAAIGPNADSYLAKWRKMEADRSALSWNWPAFLANLFWFAYRKMWVPLAAAVVLFLVTDFVAGRDPAYVKPAWLFLFLLILISGAIGNALYRRQVTRMVAKADGLDQPVALAQIGAQGGVSIPGLVSSLAIFLLLFIAGAVAQMNRMRANPPQPVANAAAPADQQAAPSAPAQPDQNPPPAAPTQSAVTLDWNYMVGRWTSEPNDNCGSAFNNDGTFTAPDGARGYWSLTGNQLTLTANSSLTVRVEAIDANTMTLLNPDGTLVRATRC